MDIHTALKKGKSILISNNIVSAKIDSEILMSNAINKDKKFIILNPNKKIEKRYLNYFYTLIQERVKRRPVAQIIKKKESQQKEIVERLMAEFSITHLRNVKATALSGGERRRTEIARCLINNPKVLLLDEPFAGVDLLSIQDIKGLLLKLQARGCAVLVTDHNASQLLSVVDRAYVIANGTIVANGTPREIVNTTEAKKLYFGEDFTF